MWLLLRTCTVHTCCSRMICHHHDSKNRTLLGHMSILHQDTCGLAHSFASHEVHGSARSQTATEAYAQSTSAATYPTPQTSIDHGRAPPAVRVMCSCSRLHCDSISDWVQKTRNVFCHTLHVSRPAIGSMLTRHALLADWT